MKIAEHDLVIEREVSVREGRTDVIVDTVVQVLAVYPGVAEVFLARQLRRFCFVDGYPALGRHLPTEREPVGVITDNCRPLFF